jgi:competence ComEA-like helix-hairpin-helix protein
VDLNSATEKDLTAVPGIGPGLARKIVLQREKLGGFSNLADLRQVPGVGPKRLDAWAPWLFVSKPQKPGESDVDTDPRPTNARTEGKSVEKVSVNVISSPTPPDSR